MSNESWQWVDEDPIEKLLRPSPPVAAAAATSAPRVGWGVEELMAAGRAHFDLLKFEEAAGSYSGAVAAAPNHAAAHFDLAVCQEKLGLWKAAAASFERSLDLDPNRPQALIGLGACLLQLDSTALALGCF